MESSAARPSGSTFTGKTAVQGDCSGQIAESTQSQDARGPKKRAIKKTTKPIIERIEEVDNEIARLKPPPKSMTRQQFKQQFPKLANEGDNPHRFRKGRVSPEALKEIFGEPYGEGGRQGYGWAHCKYAEVVTRVQYLHPIVYQHSVSEIPPYLKIHFAEGVAVEFNEGKGKVDWCAFGADTNKRQVNRYDQSKQKLLALRKTLEGDKPLQVRGRDWQKIKLELGEGGGSLASSSMMKTRVVGDSMTLIDRTKSKFSETGDCGGPFESGMGSGLSVDGVPEKSQRGGSWSQDSVKERGQVIQDLMNVLSVEMKADAARHKDAMERRDQCKLKLEQSECLLRSYENQKVEKAFKIEAMVGEGADVDREKIKMECIMDQCADEQSTLQTCRSNLELAELVVENMVHGIEAHRLQFEALKMELVQIRYGKSLGTFWPQPIVYPEEKDAENWDGSAVLVLSMCSLCQFSFPTNDIIVSSCRHLYHPFCASVVFVGGGPCIAKGCHSEPHPEWHRSFGWSEPSAKMVQKAAMLGCVEEQRKILQFRMKEAKAADPIAGFAEHNFSRPASGYSPASFTEGAASQAINPAVNVCAIPSVAVLDVPKSDPPEGRASDVIKPLEVCQVRKRKKKVPSQLKEQEITFECLEVGGVRGKGEEPELFSGDETSSDPEQAVNLPSSSGTTISSAERGDSVLQEQSNSKDCEEVHKGAKGNKEIRISTGETSNAKKLSPQKLLVNEVITKVLPEEIQTSPALRTSDERNLSPQMPLLSSRVANEEHMKLVHGGEAADVIELEEQQHPAEVDNLHVQQRNTVDAVQIDSQDEIPGSDCLEGRKALQIDLREIQVGESVQEKNAEEAGGKEDMMEEPERTTVKKRNSSGSKKRKRSGEVAEEELFPTSMENLYSAGATTLTALTEMVMQEGEGDGDEVAHEDGLDHGCAVGGSEAAEENEGSQAPLQSSAAAERVKTRSQDKLQSKAQVKRKKKRRTN